MLFDGSGSFVRGEFPHHARNRPTCRRAITARTSKANWSPLPARRGRRRQRARRRADRRSAADRLRQESGIYCYAPAIGTAHGFYKRTPEIRYDALERLVAATGMPMVLHGGSGLADDVFRRLIALGTAKVNISTALKKTYNDGFRHYLDAHPQEYDPAKLIAAVHGDVMRMAQRYFALWQRRTGVKIGRIRNAGDFARSSDESCPGL